MSPNTTTTGDVDGITIRYTEDFIVEDNNNNDNVNKSSGPFVLNLSQKQKMLVTNIDPTDPTPLELVVMHTILHAVYQVVPSHCLIPFWIFQKISYNGSQKNL